MTLAAGLYWLALAAVVAWAGLQPAPLAVFFLMATALVSALGWAPTRACKGDLLARGDPLAGLLLAPGATRALGWPMAALFCAQAPSLLVFGLAALRGTNFLPHAWPYRARAHALPGTGTVPLAAQLQRRGPRPRRVGDPAGDAGLLHPGHLGRDLQRGAGDPRGLTRARRRRQARLPWATSGLAPAEAGPVLP